MTEEEAQALVAERDALKARVFELEQQFEFHGYMRINDKFYPTVHRVFCDICKAPAELMAHEREPPTWRCKTCRVTSQETLGGLLGVLRDPVLMRSPCGYIPSLNAPNWSMQLALSGEYAMIQINDPDCHLEASFSRAGEHYSANVYTGGIPGAPSTYGRFVASFRAATFRELIEKAITKVGGES